MRHIIIRVRWEKKRLLEPISSSSAIISMGFVCNFKTPILIYWKPTQTHTICCRQHTFLFILRKLLRFRIPMALQISIFVYKTHTLTRDTVSSFKYPWKCAQFTDFYLRKCNVQQNETRWGGWERERGRYVWCVVTMSSSVWPRIRPIEFHWVDFVIDSRRLCNIAQTATHRQYTTYSLCWFFFA